MPRVALITGASRGIGAACVRRLAADGMAVAINSYPDERSLAEAEALADEIRLSGSLAAVFGADISSATAVEEMFSQCETQLGKIYALVVNAATTVRQPWIDIAEAEWDRVFAVNLKGALFCCQRAFGSSNTPNDGVIVTVGSVLAKIGSQNSLHYATSKAGLLGFTRSLAKELGPSGIRVNCVVPGAIRTEAEVEAFPDEAEYKRTILKLQILQQLGRPEDIASVVSFLTSPDSAFMTGQAINIDGGWTSI